MADEQPIDWLGLGDKDAADKRTPGLCVLAPMRDHSLAAAELEHRQSGAPEFIGSHDVLFVEEDGLTLEEAHHWQIKMRFPRPPTENEIDAFKRYQQAKLTAAFWATRRQAQEQDDADEAAIAQRRIDRLGGQPARSYPGLDPIIGPAPDAPAAFLRALDAPANWKSPPPKGNGLLPKVSPSPPRFGALSRSLPTNPM
jgi:hypothetical protein